MKEILFRAKRLDNGEMVESYDLLRREDWVNEKWKIRYFMQDGYSCNQTPLTKNFIEVDPKTVSQYIGIEDKNGVKIFEGDTLKCQTEKGENILTVEWVDFRTYSGFRLYGIDRRFNIKLTSQTLINLSAEVVQQPQEA